MLELPVCHQKKKKKEREREGERTEVVNKKLLLLNNTIL